MFDFELGFCGFGHMAAAIAESSIVSETLKSNQICAFDPNSTVLQKLGVVSLASNAEIADRTRIVVLAVKPQVSDKVFGEINTVRGTVLSIMAGISGAKIREKLGCPVIRVMPNTPLLVGKACTVISERPDDVDIAVYDRVVALFRASGSVEFLPESAINATIPIASSSPALYYKVCGIMLEYAERVGLPRAAAAKLAADAMEGAAEMLRKTGLSPDELIAQVASPNGTTVRMLETLERGGFSKTLADALFDCKVRADELS